ncbi:hypothetical protein HMPREF1051_2612 [Neisseria sicca VK64]|uniref:Uncharacterized protein n=1 Tax=Neisseria sicca VK64 TaxID=1095748 RepID=I2NU49_NEISI|nr:hypothetical protein HMPREF1051_2612 [Neisseria sicca VK64]
MGCTNLIFPKPQSHPHPNLLPPDGGEGTELLINRRGRLKITIYEVSDDLV